MTDTNRPSNDLLAENKSLRIRLEEAEETLRAIGSGEVDAFVVSGPDGDQVFTLKGAEQPYRVLVETMNEGAATLAADGTILYCNTRLAAMLQVPPEKIIGTQLVTFVAPADQPLFMARMGKCAEECDNDEINMITGGGSSVPVLISCCAHDLSGSRGISLVVTDLTQQKRNEEVRAAEILARSIIEQAGEAIIVCDEEGKIIRASRLAHDLCGENLLLKPFNDLFPLWIPVNENLFSVLNLLNDEYHKNVEVEFKRGDDQIFHLVLNAAPLKFKQNCINGCVVTLTDITERKRAEEALKKLTEELENRVAERTADLREKDQLLLMQSRQAAMGEMINNIAHQWRQPLNTLGLVVQQLTLIDDPNELTREFLDECVNHSMELIQHMSKTIDDFRNFFKPDKEMIEFKVTEAIANMLSLLDGTLQDSKISIEIVEKDKPVINGYKNEFIQVLINILNNAKDALVEKKIDDRRVLITIFSEDDSAVVTIGDNAGGIPEEILNKIFDPYFSTKGSEQGTGIGLFMSKTSLRRIWVDSFPCATSTMALNSGLRCAITANIK